MSRIGEVKDLRGMGILLKQIASVTAKSGGSDSDSGKPANHQFLGQLHVPVRTIPLNGLERWYPLEGRDGTSSTKSDKNKERGEIRLTMTLSANRPQQPMGLKESFAQYERLMRIIVETEIKADPEWRGRIPESGEMMLRQLAIHRALRPLVTDVCAWSVYSAALHRRRLDFAALILPLLHRLKKSFTNSPDWAKTAIPSDVSTAAEELLNTFWTASEAMITAALSVLRHGLRSHTDLAAQPVQLCSLLEFLKELNIMGSSRPKWKDLHGRISDVVSISAADCWTRVLGGRKKVSGPICDDDRLENSIRICQALVADLKLVLTAHQEPFFKWWGMDVFAIVYQYYDAQLAGLAKPIVDGVSRTLNSVHTSEEEVVRLALEASGDVVQDSPEGEEASTAAYLNAPRLTMGTALFELYLCIQQFQKLSSSLTAREEDGKNSNENLKLEHFYSWFGTAMNRWLDMALYKALIIIGKAVNLDNLTTVDSLVKHSSSAVDTVAVFYSIKTFWEQLAWPDTEGALAYVIKIIDDISRCSLFYAEAIRLKLERLHPPPENESFFISLKICAAINSIIYVRASMKPLAEEMGCSQLPSSGPLNNRVQIQARETRQRLTANAVENLNGKLDQVFYTIARKMECEVAKLINCVLESDFNSSTRGRLSAYLYDQLSALNSLLDDPDLFDHVLHIIHQQILQGFLNVVLLDVDKKKQPGCFRHWEELLNIINESFFGPDHPEWTDETLSKIHTLLKLHGLESAELIHQYRMTKTDNLKDYGLGSLAVKAVFIGDDLVVEILNGRNLKAMDSNGSADPYVKVSILPPRYFEDVESQRTKVHKNTLFPLFDETFTYCVPRDMQTKEDCMIMFSVKDRDLITSNELIGEAYLSFQRITKGGSSTDIRDADQIILPLSVASDEQNVEYLAILEGRTWDKTAREFAKKERKNLKMIE